MVIQRSIYWVTDVRDDRSRAEFVALNLVATAGEAAKESE